MDRLQIRQMDGNQDWSWSSGILFRLFGLFLLLTWHIRLKFFDRNNFELVSRGFNWINEYQHNR